MVLSTTTASAAAQRAPACVTVPRLLHPLVWLNPMFLPCHLNSDQGGPEAALARFPPAGRDPPLVNPRLLLGARRLVRGFCRRAAEEAHFRLQRKAALRALLRHG